MFIAALVRAEIFESSNPATQPNLGKRYQMRKDELSEFENAYTESIKEPENSGLQQLKKLIGSKHRQKL